MHLFDQFSTDKYVPLSHDNTYLFDHFDRVHNFIRTRIDRKYRDILAKPQKRNFDVEWYSVYPDLQKGETSFASQQYWHFKELLEKQFEMLMNDANTDAKNWTELLRKVFNAEDNVIYSNGENITIIWGWKFENTENQKPEILASSSIAQTAVAPPADGDDTEDESADGPKEPEETGEPEIDKPSSDEVYTGVNEDIFGDMTDDDEPDVLVEKQEQKGFLEFLKEFAAKYWWLLIVLLAIIALVYFFKTAQV